MGGKSQTSGKKIYKKSVNPPPIKKTPKSATNVNKKTAENGPNQFLIHLKMKLVVNQKGKGLEHVLIVIEKGAILF